MTHSLMLEKVKNQVNFLVLNQKQQNSKLSKLIETLRNQLNQASDNKATGNTTMILEDNNES